MEAKEKCQLRLVSALHPDTRELEEAVRQVREAGDEMDGLAETLAWERGAAIIERILSKGLEVALEEAPAPVRLPPPRRAHGQTGFMRAKQKREYRRTAGEEPRELPGAARPACHRIEHWRRPRGGHSSGAPQPRQTAGGVRQGLDAAVA